jgi:2-enoate reductase
MGIAGLVNPDGSPGPRAIDYYVERARGGVGLIITGLFKVENAVEPFRVAFPSVSRHAIGPFSELAESVHSLGTKIFVQLTAGFGRVVSSSRLQGQTVSASPVPEYWNPNQTCRELKTEEVEQLVKAFGDAAEILAAAGIDGVELHGHEGYLFDQFTTALWNRRTDKYGGDLKGRLTLPLEVLKEIKKRAGSDFIVQYRFGLKHYVKGLNSGSLPGEKFIEAGRDIEEGLRMAKMLEDAGFDSLHVDAGCYDSWYWAHPPVYQEPGFMIEMAAAAKEVVRIPVIAVGKLAHPDLANAIIAEGKADMVAIGTGLLAEPFWVKKVIEGHQERIRPCIGCYEGCMGRITRGKPLSCAVNPATGRERSYRIERTERPQKVLIVGGGPAGMEAARVATMRGHRVVLYDKDHSLGGHLLEASVPEFKKDLARLLSWYEKELSSLNVEIKTGIDVTAEGVRKESPDVTILATGSLPIMPNIPGIESERVFTAVDLFRGRKRAMGKVLVLGGGLIGCEAALWLAKEGKEVTVVEILHDLMVGGIPVQHMNRLMLLDLLKIQGVEILTNTTILKVTEKGADLLERGSEKRNFPADTIVVAVGLKPDRGLYQALKGDIPNLYTIGDSREARNIKNSIWDAYEVARMI